MRNYLKMVISGAFIFVGLTACTGETNLEKAETAKNKAADGLTEAYRDTKDEVCEMINGKLECVAKKVVNKTKTLSDKIGTKATETKNKVD